MTSSPVPKRVVVLVAALLSGAALTVGCSSPVSGDAGAGAREEVARNVVFVLGDGMAQVQREFLRVGLVGAEGRLALDRLDVGGSVDTSPADEGEVTDSAAAATAFATGVRTDNGAIGVDVDGEPVTTVLELARDAGKATGLVTTAQVTDASPAAFGAHVADRDDQSAIAAQYLDDTRVDVLLGGGEDHWLPAGDEGAHPDRPAEDESEESAGGEGDLVAHAEELGYRYVSDAAGLAAASSGDRLLGLFANEEMFQQAPEGEGDRYAPTVPLADMTRAALDALDDRDAGFFLLVEEEGIDEMAHHNNAALVLEAGRALEAAVEVVLQFQAEHPDTLVIVAGDHETGGMEIELTGPGEQLDGADGPFPVGGSDQQVWVRWSTFDHTDADTPITAAGPGAEAFEGEIDNTDVSTGMAEAMGLRTTG